MTAACTIDQALADGQLLGAALGDIASWQGWLAILRAAFGLPLTPEQYRVFDEVAGARLAPAKRVRELWAIIGRRSGKSRMAAAIAVFQAAFGSYRLAPGEIGHVLVLAASKSQASAVFQYIKAFLDQSSILRQQVTDVTADEIRLKGNIAISVHSNSFRSVRGRTLIAAIFDEAAFWRDETSSQPDIETYRAVLPSLMTTQGILVGISSPYGQRGLLYDKFQTHFGKPGDDVLVVRAPTTVLNPTINAGLIAAATADDPEAARSEWQAEFRGDLSAYIDRATLDRCLEPGIRERAPQMRFRYAAFCDPSGGAHDSMCLSISHRESARVVLDCVREVRPPFEPAEVTADFARLLKTYRIMTVRGDNYSAEWVRTAFRSQGISYMPADKPKSQLYLEALPLLTNATALLLDDPRLLAQICQLERRAGRTGRDVIDHMVGAHDDLANAALGALVFAPTAERRATPSLIIQSSADYDPHQMSYRPYGGAYGRH